MRGKIVIFISILFLFTATEVFAETVEEIELTEDNYEINPEEMQLLRVAPALFSLQGWEGLFDSEYFLGPKDNVIDNNPNTKVSMKYTQGTNSKIERRYTFSKALRIDDIFLRVYSARSSLVGGTSTTTITIEFLDEANNVIEKYTKDHKNDSIRPAFFVEESVNVDVVNVKSINLTVVGKGSDIEVSEFEVFGESEIYESIDVLNLLNVTDNSIELDWINPNDNRIISNEVFIDDERVFSNSKINSYKFEKLSPDTDYNIKVNVIYSNGVSVSTSIKIKTLKPDPKVSVKLSYASDGVAINLNKSNYTDAVKIYRDNEFVLETSDDFYLDRDVVSEKTYTYKFIPYRESTEGEILTEKIKTEKITVKNLKVTKNTFEQVDLSWDNPDVEEFEYVAIYRKEKSSPVNMLSSFSFRSLFSFNGEDEKGAKLFETNGTVFRDFTVKSEKEYVYTLNAFLENEELEGVKVEVKTPKVSVVGSAVLKDEETQDYIINWSTPKNGKIKILIGGKDYKIVDASLLSTNIPKNDIKLDLFNNPDIKLVPINEDGKEGITTIPSGSSGTGGIDSLGNAELAKTLNLMELLKSGIALLGIVGAFVLLGLAFRVVPRLVVVIRNSFLNNKTR